MKTRYEVVYAAIGRLFHAVAACDRRVAKEEHRILNELIARRWLALEQSHDAYGTDAAYYIGFAFDTAVEQHAAVDADLLEFKEAMREHPSLFTDAMKTLVWETAHAIAQARNGERAAEQELLAHLGRLLHGKPMPA